jgi:hypothetical protein
MVYSFSKICCASEITRKLGQRLGILGAFCCIPRRSTFALQTAYRLPTGLSLPH